MSEYDYDLLVIGAGSGGVRASRISAQLGARVAVVEESALGGTCINLGCVPKKLFVYASHYSENVQAAPGFGWKMGASQFDWQTLLANKDREIIRLNEAYGRLLDKAGVEVFTGRGKILGPHHVAIGERDVTAERILIAVGGSPWKPDIPGIDAAITSNEAFHLKELPDRIVIVGGGYIAVEFAGIFNGLGVETHLCYRDELFLRGFDWDLREFLASELRKKGIHLHFHMSVSAIEACADGYQVFTESGEAWNTDLVMYATGRLPKTTGLGLDNTLVELNADGGVIVDDDFQTREPSIYALGDVTGPIELTPVALAQGEALARHLYANDQRKVGYENVPVAVFSQPTVSAVGLTEYEARTAGIDIAVYKNDVGPMQYALADTNERAFVKLVVDRRTDRVLGCHIVGPDASEIIQGLAVAMNAGATKADFDRTIGIHPTLAEEFVTLRQPSAPVSQPAREL